MNYVDIDYEFNRTREPKYNLVSVAFKTEDSTPKSVWLLNRPDAWRSHRKEILRLRDKGYIFCAFNVVAEARCFISLGIDPTKCKWMDLQIEWRMLTNHWHKYQYGWQYISKNKCPTFTTPPKPKWQETEEDKFNHSKAEHNLVAATYKLLGKERDSEHKDHMRDIIISEDDKLIMQNANSIMEYGEEDIEDLSPMRNAIIGAYAQAYHDFNTTKVIDEMLLRGHYAALSAKMEARGYPINVTKVNNFTNSVPDILKDLAEDINSQDIPMKPFQWNNREQRYSMRVKKIQEWIESENFDNWLQTDSGKPSCSLDAFTKYFDFKHDFPRDNLGAQLVRYLKTKQSLNGFMPQSKTSRTKPFITSVSSLGRSHPYMGIFGSQSGRSQPKASSFIPLKSAWMRALIEPPKGKALASIDYGSQEFLISACVSKDKAMYEAYVSGDVYLAFAKASGAVPQDATKKTHALQRNAFKSSVLGISYNMGAAALANKMTNDTGIQYTEKQAQEFIDLFAKVYPDFAKWNETNLDMYRRLGYIKMPCGWTMWGCNNNWRSTNNVPIQGRGASLMRKAVDLCNQANIDVIYTLHDALYIEYPLKKYEYIDKLRQCMLEAFVHYFEGEQREWAKAIRLDADTWSPQYPEGHIVTPGDMTVKQQSIYIDERSKSDYERFSKYF